MKKSIPYIIGIGELQRKASNVIKAVDNKHGEGFIVSHNEPKAVLMSLQRYEKLARLEHVKRLEEDEILALVEQGDQEYEAGQTRNLKSLSQII